MNKLLKLIMFTICVGIVVGLFSAIASKPLLSNHSNNEGVGTSLQPLPAHTLYGYLRYDEMVKKADVIFVGKVSSISHTQWNQDNGQIWYDDANSQPGIDISSPLQLHYIDFEVNQLITDKLGTGKVVRATVIGTSPLDGADDADHDLKVGDQVVVFARSTELTWRNGTKSIIQLMGFPGNAYLKNNGKDDYSGRLRSKPISLADLTGEIRKLRDTNVQP